MKFSSGKEWIEHFQKNPESAWQSLLKEQNRLIMAVIRKLVEANDDIMELYTHTLENLKQNDCNKLTTYFSQPRKYSFETWIAVVVRNCCMDWFRKEKGRKRILKCIKELPTHDQWIFRYIYWHRYSYEMTHQLIKYKHDFNLSFEEMCDRITHINEILQQKTRWQISADWKAILPPLPLESVESENEHSAFTDLTNKQSISPEEQHIVNDSVYRLKEALKTLSPEEQLIIQLHFYRGLTLQEITRVLKMKNLWQVHRKLKKALKNLKKKLQEKGIGPSDLEIL